MFLIKPYLVQSAGAITRASTATYHDSAGVLRYAAVDEVRPIIEETASTNLVRYSQGTSQYSLSTSGTATLTVISGSLNSSPDNPASSYARLLVSSGGTHYAYSTASNNDFLLTTGNTYTASCYIKTSDVGSQQVPYARFGIWLGGSDLHWIHINLVTGTLMTSSGIVQGSVAVESLTNTWKRVSFRFTKSTTETCELRIYPCSSSSSTTYTSGSHNDSLYFFGLQVEQGNLSSYIPTNGATVTRAADITPAQPAGTSQLLSSNIAFNDYAEWSAGTAYTAGQRVIRKDYSIYIYEAIASSTGVDPVTDTTNKWLNIGAVNRWKMFDSYLSTSTISTSGISVAIRPGYSIDSISLINVKAKTLRVIMTDPVEGEVLNRFYNLYSSTLSSSNWYNYFFEETSSFKKIVVIDDLPKSGHATVTIQLDNSGYSTECGLLVVGRKQIIGDGFEYGSTSGIVDYSVKETDQFGNINVTPRAYADRVNYRVFLSSGREFEVKNILASARATPCVYVGNKDMQNTITYGYFKNFDIALQHPSYSDYNLEVEGLT